MDCKLIDCDNTAVARLITPFGTANLCGGHAAVAASEDTDERHTFFRGPLQEVFRCGPKEDPPLDGAREAGYPRMQRRGAIVDYVGAWDGDRAACVCVHGKSWPEGDLYEANGGRACAECVAGVAA